MENFDSNIFFGLVWVHVVITIIAVYVLRILSHQMISFVIRKSIKKHKYSSRIEEKQREDTLISVLSRLAMLTLYVGGLIVILYEVGVNVFAMLTALGAASLIVGFGAQAMIRNFLAGFFILFENQYSVGDIVGLYANGAEKFGVVETITLRVTRLRDLDGNLIIVQNGDASPVTNMSTSWANVNVDVGIGYDDDLDEAIEVMNQVGLEQSKDPKWKDNIIEPIQFYRVNEFADNSVILKAVGKMQPATQWATAGDFRYRIKKAFDEHNIDIPVSQVVLHQARKVTSKNHKAKSKSGGQATPNKSEVDDVQSDTKVEQ